MNAKADIYPTARPAAQEDMETCVYRIREYGDKNAFEVIFRTHYQRLHGFASTFTGCPDTAEDIIQSIFLNIWLNKESWNPAGEVKTYLFKAVRNECLNHIRHQKIVQHAEPLIRQQYEDEEGDVVSTTRQEIFSMIDQETDKLPEACRQIFQLSRKHGLTYREIAEYLDISINTVNTQMGRALKKIRESLSEKAWDTLLFTISFLLLL